MKYILTVFLVFYTLISFSQNKYTFISNDVIEIYDNNKIKVYLDDIYRITYKKCAKFYMKCKIDTSTFEYNDTTTVYYVNGNTRVICFFEQNKLNGNYRSLYKNGNTETLGILKKGIRIGLWKFYYNNGKLKKTIDYKDGEGLVLLLEFYKKDGKEIIKNGCGKFKDSYPYSALTTGLATCKGEVKNGLMNGTWTVRLDNILICKEEFKSGKLIEGIQYSKVFGKEVYHNNPISVMSGIIYLEHAKFHDPSFCGEDVATNVIIMQIIKNLHI